jgi:hypothetical protein
MVKREAIAFIDGDMVKVINDKQWLTCFSVKTKGGQGKRPLLFLFF